MALSTAVEAKLGEIERAARVLGENLSRQAFGERGPDLKVTLVDMEQALRPLVQALASGFLAASTGDQTERLATTLPCPDCGHECQRRECERTLTGEHGPFTWCEPVCRCERCDRSFFPP
jgi:hypothetical protein